MSTDISTPVAGFPAAEGREAEMKQHGSGGFTFVIDKWKIAERFLIMGSESGKVKNFAGENSLPNCDSLVQCIKEDSKRMVDLITNVSDQGRTINNDYPLLALALALAYSPTPEEKYYARQSLNKIARTGTHILHFADFVNKVKGWGTGTRKAFQQWYLSKSAEDIAFQCSKYKQRDGWSHKDILSLAHPFGTPEQNNIFSYVTSPNKFETDESMFKLPAFINAIKVLPTYSVKEAAALIRTHKLPREIIPDNLLSEPDIWEAMLPSMGMEAIIRNLGKMTSIGVLSPRSSNTNFVVRIIDNEDNLQRSRTHPIKIYTALRTYAEGKGLLGSLTWAPVKEIIDALDSAFTKSFKYVIPSNKNLSLNIDVSGSMGWKVIPGTNIFPKEAAAVMAMATARSEPNCQFWAFSTELTPIDIQPGDSLSSVLNKTSGIPMGHTFTSLPMINALNRKLDVDAFHIYTDSEVNAGPLHPFEAMKRYRKELDKPRAKLASIQMNLNDFTIADPNDIDMIDVPGFDTSTPQLLSNFVSY